MNNTTPINVLDAISEYRGYHSSIILSYGANLPFYEQGVLKRLRNSDSRNNLIFMDAGRYQETITHSRDTIGFVGKRYLIVPIDLGRFQSFHPKVILLLGTDRGRALIGTGNLTFSGYGDNLEIFTSYDWSEESPKNVEVFASLWNVIISKQKEWRYSAQAIKMIEKAAFQSPWLQTSIPLESAPVFSSINSPLITAIGNRLERRTVNNITIFSPFLDQQAKGLRAFYEQFKPEEIKLILQPNHSAGNPSSLVQLRAEGLPIKIFQAMVQDRYIHAKVYLFETDGNTVAFTGSANCTKAGILSGVKSGNFEILACHEFQNSEDAMNFFESGIQFEPVFDPLTLTLRDLDSTEQQNPTSIQLYDAAIDGTILMVEFNISESIQGIETLRLKSDFPSSIEIPIPDFSLGQNKFQMQLGPESFSISQGICSVYLLGENHSGERIVYHSNSLWLTNQTELNKRVSFLTQDDELSAMLLREKLLGNDQQWTQLYATLSNLVELNLGQVNRTSLATKTRRESETQNDTSQKESMLKVIDDIAEEESRLGEIEFELNKESRIYSWLEIVLGMFPQERAIGQERVLAGSSEVHLQTPVKPKEDIGRSFLRLVKRYIRVLQNEEYVQSLPTYQFTAYFTIFQRIIWLLYCSEVLSKEDYYHFSIEILGLCFGETPGKSVPFFLPTVHEHLSRRHETVWRDSQAHLHALVNLLMLESIFTEDKEKSKFLKTYYPHLLSCLICIIPPQEIDADLEDIEQIASFFNCGAEGLSTSLKDIVLTHLAASTKMLRNWILLSDTKLEDSVEQDDQKIYFNARVTLGIGEKQIRDFLQKPQERNQWITLIQWCMSADRQQSGNRYLERLAYVFQRHDLTSLLVKPLFELGKNARNEKRYKDALTYLEQAMQAAKEVGDQSYIQMIDQYRTIVRYSLPRD